MNKTLFETKQLLLALVWLISSLAVQPGIASGVAGEHGLSKDVLVDRVENISQEIDIQFTPIVEKAIFNYTVRGKHATERLLGRVNIYFPIIENSVYSKGLPEIIKYIPIIESSLRPEARSSAGAVGLWQFMKPTARMFDLRVNRTLDERKDPVKSSVAATEYLAHLYEQFGDWTVAIAAYNCGPGNVRKAIRRSGSSDFWGMRKFLPKETQQYIPKLIAAAYLMKYYHYHDLIPEPVNSELIHIASTTVFEKMDFEDLAENLDMEIETLITLNTEYLRNYIPKNTTGHNLDIPANKLYAFYEKYQPEKLFAKRINRLAPLAAKQLAVIRQKRKKLAVAEQLPMILPERLYSLTEIQKIRETIVATL